MIQDVFVVAVVNDVDVIDGVVVVVVDVVVVGVKKHSSAVSKTLSRPFINYV